MLPSAATETPRYHLPGENTVKSKTAYRDRRSRVIAKDLTSVPGQKDISPLRRDFRGCPSYGIRTEGGGGNNRETSGRDPAESTWRGTFVFGRRPAKRVCRRAKITNRHDPVRRVIKYTNENRSSSSGVGRRRREMKTRRTEKGAKSNVRKSDRKDGGSG